MSEHYNLRWGDIKLKHSSDGTEYLEHYERQTKTTIGENIVDICQIKPKMFPKGDARDPEESYKLDFRTITFSISQNAQFL